MKYIALELSPNSLQYTYNAPQELTKMSTALAGSWVRPLSFLHLSHHVSFDRLRRYSSIPKVFYCMSFLCLFLTRPIMTEWFQQGTNTTECN